MGHWWGSWWDGFWGGSSVIGWVYAALVAWGVMYAATDGAVCAVTWYDMTGWYEAVCWITEQAGPPPCQGPGC